MRPFYLALIFGGLLAITSLYVLQQPEKVLREAEALAGERPYCLQIPATGSEYKAARSTRELTVLSMRGSHAIHHAVLVIGDVEQAEFFHWSYRFQRFIKGTYGMQPIYCAPHPHYLLKPVPVRADEETRLNFYMAGMNFSIPKEYRPYPLWADHFGLTFHAEAPQFLPTGQHESKASDYIVVTFREENSRLALWAKTPSGARVLAEETGPDGLKKQVWEGTSRQIRYSLRASDSRVTTVIQCFDNQDVQCLHSFEQDGWTYDFHHMPADLPAWREMEKRLVDLNKSFIRNKARNVHQQ